MARNQANNTVDRLRAMEELLITMRTVIRQQVQNQKEGDFPNRDVLGSIARYRPNTYKGQEDPAILEDWIRHFDKIFEATNYEEPQKISAAVYYLSDIADVWWQNHQKVRQHLPDYSWEEFKTDLRERFYPQSIRQAKYEEFMTLKQGPLSVQEYYQKFTELERFAPIYADNEVKRARKFEMGLNTGI